ncbi:hypothetical protein D9M72_620480 [compost metagenome]
MSVTIVNGGSTGRPINALSFLINAFGLILTIKCSKSGEYLSRTSAPTPVTKPRRRETMVSEPSTAKLPLPRSGKP